MSAASAGNDRNREPLGTFCVRLSRADRKVLEAVAMLSERSVGAVVRGLIRDAARQGIGAPPSIGGARQE